MDMSIQREGSFWQRLFSAEGLTSVSHVFVMEWLGDPARPGSRPVDRRLRSPRGCPKRFGRNSFWPTTRAGRRCGDRSWGPSWRSCPSSARSAMCHWPRCSGTAASASVASIAFIFADLLIIPILNIYRKYYGAKMMLTLLGTLYAAMVAAGYLVELLFGTANLIPTQRSTPRSWRRGSRGTTPPGLTSSSSSSRHCCVVRFFTTGGMPMLRMMGGSPEATDGHHHHGHQSD